MTRRRVFRRINKRLHGCKQWGKNCLLVPFAISLHCSGWWWGWIKSQLRWNFAKVFNNDLPGSQVILTPILSSDLWLIEFQLGNWCNTDLGTFHMKVCHNLYVCLTRSYVWHFVSDEGFDKYIQQKSISQWPVMATELENESITSWESSSMRPGAGSQPKWKLADLKWISWQIHHRLGFERNLKRLRSEDKKVISSLSSRPKVIITGWSESRLSLRRNIAYAGDLSVWLERCKTGLGCHTLGYSKENSHTAVKGWGSNMWNFKV